MEEQQEKTLTAEEQSRLDDKKLNIIQEINPDNSLIINKEDKNAVSKGKFKKFWDSIKGGIVPFLIFLAVQELSWTGNMFLGKSGFQPEIWLDKQIPIVSEFIWMYFLTFPLAIFAFFWVTAKNKKHMWNLWLTAVISFAISGIVYFFWQTEMIKPDFVPATISDKFMVWTWSTCKPINCLPSQHCLMALALVIAASGEKKSTPLWMRILAWMFCVLIFMATLFLRQHYILDLVASIVVMVPTYLITKYCKFGEWMLKKQEQSKYKKQLKSEQ